MGSALFGNDRTYTLLEVQQDRRCRCYTYSEIDCKKCSRGTGLFVHVSLFSATATGGSTRAYCVDCSGNSVSGSKFKRTTDSMNDPIETSGEGQPGHEQDHT